MYLKILQHQIDEEEEIVKIAEQAARNIGVEPKIETGGGGSDANIFAEHGLVRSHYWYRHE